jgi:hypothetical protein
MVRKINTQHQEAGLLLAAIGSSAKQALIEAGALFAIGRLELHVAHCELNLQLRNSSHGDCNRQKKFRKDTNANRRECLTNQFWVPRMNVER